MNQHLHDTFKTLLRRAACQAKVEELDAELIKLNLPAWNPSEIRMALQVARQPYDHQNPRVSGLCELIWARARMDGSPHDADIRCAEFLPTVATRKTAA